MMCAIGRVQKVVISRYFVVIMLLTLTIIIYFIIIYEELFTGIEHMRSKI